MSSMCIECGQVMARHTCVQRCYPCLRALQKVQHPALWAVRRAIRRGELLPASWLSCADCSRPAAVYDHRDYRKPLDVVPVCRGCNYRRGPALWREAA